jgi:hypothetical protein
VRMVCFNLLLFGIEVVWEQKLSFGNKTLDKSQKNVIPVLRRRRTYASKSNRKNSIFLYDKKIIQKEDIRWCVYLFQKWILNTVSYTILYFIGCYIATPVQVILYLLNFEVLRRKSDGYHAKTPFRCILLSTSIEIVDD